MGLKYFIEITEITNINQFSTLLLISAFIIAAKTEFNYWSTI